MTELLEVVADSEVAEDLADFEDIGISVMDLEVDMVSGVDSVDLLVFMVDGGVFV